MPVSRPRRSAGDISEMKRGAATVETPIPIPPIKREIAKRVTLGAKAEPIAETK